jgi:hypothetical protein
MGKSVFGCARLALLVLAMASACADADHSSGPLPWFGRTRGSAVVLSRDERVAVVTSRSAGVVTVFQLDPEAPLAGLVVGRTEIDMGAGSEPWAAVIGGDDDSAYVIARHAQTVTRIVDLHGTPRRHGALEVGSEPTAIVIAPSGNRLFIANWGEGTISVVTTPDFKLIKPGLDLNAALVATGVLGDVQPRLGLAHPRALALTDDGDDDDGDETLYATEFFSMPLLDAGTDPGPGYFDRNRQGFVYPIRLARQTRVGEPIPIAPVADTSFLDSRRATTGCFPNQLYAAATANDRLFVTSMCASPEGPLGFDGNNSDPNANFKTIVHPAVFVIDTRTNRELPEQGWLLTRALEQRYAQDPASERRMPLIPNDLAVTAGAAPGAIGPHATCITAFGADAVFCVHYDPRGGLLEIGARGRRYLDLAAAHGAQIPGRLPIGIALSRRRSYGLVVSDNSQVLSVIDLGANAVRATEPTVKTISRGLDVIDSAENEGRQLFATGLGVWSFLGEARLSCEGCHPDGLSDGVTWFFPRGPRRTISTAGTYDAKGDQRVLLWTANVDEVHDVEAIVRSVAGGVGAILWQYPSGGDAGMESDRILYDGNEKGAGKRTSALRNNLSASMKELLSTLSIDEGCKKEARDGATCNSSAKKEWNKIDEFIQSVRAPKRPVGLDSAQVARGAGLFRDGGCASCHGGPGWTLSRVFYTPGPTNNGVLPYLRPETSDAVMLGRLRTESYSVPAELRALNPPGASGSATFRPAAPTGVNVLDYLYADGMDGRYNSKETHKSDQINCVLRAVGTFPPNASQAKPEGVVPDGSPTVVRELRDDMTKLALGGQGFNMPSLAGVAAGAPYFHAGNARSLEELFDPAFAGHYQALAPGFLSEASEHRSSDVDDLVAYLLSIDDDWPTEPAGPDLCVSTSGPFE